MSYSKGLALSSPKLASIDDTTDNIVTAGKRRSTVGLIGNFEPANLQLDWSGTRDPITCKNNIGKYFKLYI
jgi:hypothetical protein